MTSSFPLDFSNFELEITNRCNLSCPGCSRTDFIDRFPKVWHNHDLNLDEFKRFIQPIIDQIEIFEFKGTMGDPIFHPNFIEWIKWCKSLGKKVFIHTNGQAGKSFWKRLALLVDKNDKIVLGIDGLKDDFMTYRINAKWKNIEACAQVIAEKTRLVWQYIIFKYNQHEIDQARRLSEAMGFDEFLAFDSKRWPTDQGWIKDDNESSNKEYVFKPDCLEKPMHIVTSDGYYMPCCMLLDHRWRYKTPFAQTYRISKMTMADVIKSSIANDFYAKLDEMNAPSYCKTICGKCHG